MGKRVNTATWIESRKRWQINVQKNSIRKTFVSSTPGRNGQREANKKADSWLDDNVEDSKKKVSSLYGKMLKEIQLTTGTENYIQFEKNGRLHILPVIGKMRIENLTEQDLQNILNKAFKKGLAKKTISNIRANVVFFMKFARKCNATTLLPENLTIPKNAPSPQKIILQPEDLKTLFNNDNITLHNKNQFDRYVFAYRFAVVTGLRPGELLGLKWNDIQKNGLLTINRSISRLNEITEGKNENAKRRFALTDLGKKILLQQATYLNSVVNGSKYVFPDKDGEHTSLSTFSKRWNKYKKEYSLPSVTLYELRHTFISIVKELPDGLLKPIVGHSEVMDTFGVYGHIVEGEMQHTANLMQDIFDKYI